MILGLMDEMRLLGSKSTPGLARTRRGPVAEQAAGRGELMDEWNELIGVRTEILDDYDFSMEHGSWT